MLQMPLRLIATLISRNYNVTGFIKGVVQIVPPLSFGDKLYNLCISLLLRT